MAMTTKNPLKLNTVTLIAALADTTWAIGASLTATWLADPTA